MTAIRRSCSCIHMHRHDGHSPQGEREK
jgi:hypothetical protein